jgi:large subunit ribosomal protein L22
MQISATHKYLRIAPRKVRLVADLIKGKKVLEARATLKYTTRAAAEPLEKALRSAVASAKHNFQLEELNLYITRVIVNEGPKLKRYRPRARGRAFPIQKKTSHITVVLDEIIPTADMDQKKGEKVSRKTAIETEEKKKERTIAKPKFKTAKDTAKPKVEGGSKRIFRRKAI